MGSTTHLAVLKTLCEDARVESSDIASVIVESRQAVLRVVAPLLAAGSLVMVVAAAHASMQDRPSMFATVSAVTLAATTLALYFARERSTWAGGLALCLGTLICSAMGILQFGPLLGSGALLIAWVLFSVFFLDQLVLPLLALPLVVLTIGVAVQHSVLHVSWTLPQDGMAGWLRMTASVWLVSLALAYLFRRLLHEVDAASRLAHSARVAEEAARQEREAVATARWASQRMEMLGQLAGGVAHDFNNVLTVLISSADALRKSRNESERIELLDEIDKASQAALATTRQLLSFSRQGAEPTRTAMPGAVLPTFARSIRRLLPETIVVVSTVEDNLPPVRVAGGELQQVLLNLCLNARDAMPNGGTLHLRARLAPWRNDSVDMVVIEVEDTGAGMDTQTRARALEPFFTTKQSGLGTGLGLAMVRSTVQKAEGRVELLSEKGQGTCVQMYLPVSEVHVSQSPVLVPQLAEQRGTRVLLVEDDDQVRRAFARVLASAGHEVLTASSVEDAMGIAAQRDDFDLLVCDAVLGDGNPGRLIRQLREKRPLRPILVCSGHLLDDDMIEGVQSHEFAFLQKPIAPAALTSTIQALLTSPEFAVEKSQLPS
jgi:signal transduction histidine kinase/ActR/RegA family two-component response regulator